LEPGGEACRKHSLPHSLRLAAALDTSGGRDKSLRPKAYIRISPSAFRELQSARGKRGGRPSLGEPWAELGISRRTYFRRRKSGDI